MSNYRQIIPPGFSPTSRLFRISNEYFLVFPKNASNTILFGTDFIAEEANLNELRERISINIFLREPIDRFKSALIESLKRCSLYNNDRYISNYSSVPVSHDIKKIYENFFDSLNNNPNKFILQILDILSSHFYDPHLCPQWYFFTDLNKRTISTLKVHNLRNI